MKIIQSIACFLFLIAFSGCNTGKKIVKNAYAYTSIRMPGTLPVDENGRPLYKGPDTSTLIYVETVRDGIVWEHAWSGNKSFSINPVLVNNIPVELGNTKSTGEWVVVSPKQGGKIWQLLLVPSENLVSPETLKQGEILLQGKYKDKQFTRKITSVPEVAGPDAQ